MFKHILTTVIKKKNKKHFIFLSQIKLFKNILLVEKKKRKDILQKKDGRHSFSYLE